VQRGLGADLKVIMKEIVACHRMGYAKTVCWYGFQALQWAQISAFNPSGDPIHPNPSIFTIIHPFHPLFLVQVAQDVKDALDGPRSVPSASTLSRSRFIDPCLHVCTHGVHAVSQCDAHSCACTCLVCCDVVVDTSPWEAHHE